ncbi:MAG: alpha/beta hydrolase, partial [Bdellovibrionales bacterium]|nr:alpha/beta hydrolase [Bdellovibrionales bacterium]
LDAQRTVVGDGAGVGVDVPEVDVVGSSLGGALGFWLCSTLPQKFFGFLGISPAIAIGDRFSYRAAGWLRKAPLIDRGIPLLRFLLNELFVLLLLTKVRGMIRPLGPDQRLIILGPYLDDGTSMICFYKSLDLIRDPRLETAWRSSKHPATLVWGRRDHVVPIKNLDLLVSAKPDSKAIIIEDAGHHPMEDAPEKVLAVILDTLNPHKSSLS